MILGQEEKDAINRIVEKNWWPAGEECIMMEREAADYLGIKHCVLANSGSSAGLLGLASLELPKGSEVIIPATTFPTIFNIILQLGLKPVVCDSKIGSYTLDVDEVRKLIRRKTRAIIAVHPVGNPVDMPRLMKLVEGRGIYVLEDNCDGWGGSIVRQTLDRNELTGELRTVSQKLGTFGHLSFTSFHAAHICSMGQGGGVFTNDDEIARRVMMYRDWGRQSDIPRRTNDGKWEDLPADYDMRFIYEKVGWNLGPLELQCAMGREQLKKVEDIKAKRKANYEYFIERLEGYPGLIMPDVVEGADPSWFALPLTYTGDRGKLVEHLEERGIETRSMFAGNILKHPAYKGLKVRKGNLSHADYILEHSFWIGVHPTLTEEEREYVVQAFDDFFNE